MVTHLRCSQANVKPDIWISAYVPLALRVGKRALEGRWMLGLVRKQYEMQLIGNGKAGGPTAQGSHGLLD